MAIETTKAEKGERYTIKQMEKTKKSLNARLSRLNDASRKDNVVTFEQNKFPDKDTFSMKIGNRGYTEKKEAGAASAMRWKSALIRWEIYRD